MIHQPIHLLNKGKETTKTQTVLLLVLKSLNLDQFVLTQLPFKNLIKTFILY